MTSPGGFDGFFRALSEAYRAGELGEAAYRRASAMHGIHWMD
jgi:hypothetical protein